MTWKEPPQPFDESDDAGAFGIGLGHGFRRIDPRPGEYHYTDSNRYYYHPGFILGYILKVGVLIVGAKYGLGI